MQCPGNSDVHVRHARSHGLARHSCRRRGPGRRTVRTARAGADAAAGLAPRRSSRRPGPGSRSNSRRRSTRTARCSPAPSRMPAQSDPSRLGMKGGSCAILELPRETTANGGDAIGRGDERIRGDNDNCWDNGRGDGRARGEFRTMTASSNWARRNGSNYRRLCARPGCGSAGGGDPPVPTHPARGLAGRPRGRRRPYRG